VQPDLWETEPEYPAPGLSTHAYVLSIPGRGNVMLYNSTNAEELDEVARLGGLTSQYLSHQDEVAPSLRSIKERFGSTLRSSGAEVDVVERVSPVDVVLDERVVDDNGIEVVPTPGHSPGSTSFRYRSPHGKTYLFTGDTLYLGTDGDWHAGYIAGVSNAPALRDSLTVLAALEPDLVVSSAFAGDHGVHEVDRDRWPALVETARRALDPR
jgi:glyoxylase-like metal-dependent hydrolase (beta-lactamase superfamily II)